MDEREELTFKIEANDDDTMIALVVTSPSGKKISLSDFVMQLECYINEVHQADYQRHDIKATNH